MAPQVLLVTLQKTVNNNLPMVRDLFLSPLLHEFFFFAYMVYINPLHAEDCRIFNRIFQFFIEFTLFINNAKNFFFSLFKTFYITVCIFNRFNLHFI